MSIYDLAADLRSAAAAYYDTDVELMTDAEYDTGIEQVRQFVIDNPAQAGDFDDLLNQVAAGQSKADDVKHSTIMGSMEKITTMSAARDFVTGLDEAMVVEAKVDGLALTVHYTSGSLALAAKRGTGDAGEDVTAKVKALRVNGIPRTVGATFGFEVRGEVFLSDENFSLAQTVRATQGKEPFKNQRNAAAGIINKADPAYAGLLTFAVYEVIKGEDINFDRHAGRIAYVESLGLLSVMGLVSAISGSATTDVDTIEERINYLDTHRSIIGFPIDGAIIKVASDTVRTRLGHGSRSPKWAIAYKYDPEVGTTIVKNIVTGVGRTGRLSLQVEVEPVEVAGTTIRFASGHNVAWMVDRDLRIGDTVTISRRGDVIPYIEEVIVSMRPEGAVRWTPPENDPVGNPWDKSTLLWRSTSPELSVLGRVVYAASRDCLDIEGLGTEVAASLVESDLVKSVADLFELSLEDLTSLTIEGRSFASNGAKVHAEIVKARDVPWNRVITSLGIRMTGRTMGRRLMKAFPTMDRLRAATVDDLAKVDGIGQVKAQAVHEGLALLGEQGVLDRLAAAGVNMGQEKAADASPRPLDGATVVVSGSVPGYSRTTVAEFIEAQGGRASSSVSTSTSILVSEPSTSSKYVKAEKLGVKIVSPDEFLAGITSEAHWESWA